MPNFPTINNINWLLLFRDARHTYQQYKEFIKFTGYNDTIEDVIKFLKSKGQNPIENNVTSIEEAFIAIENT